MLSAFPGHSTAQQGFTFRQPFGSRDPLSFGVLNYRYAILRDDQTWGTSPHDRSTGVYSCEEHGEFYIRHSTATRCTKKTAIGRNMKRNIHMMLLGTEATEGMQCTAPMEMLHQSSITVKIPRRRLLDGWLLKVLGGLSAPSHSDYCVNKRTRPVRN